MNARWLQCMCAFSAVKIIWSINSPWKDNCGTTMKSFSFFLFWKVMTLLPSFIWWYCVHFCGYGACAIITRIAITIWCSVLHLLHFRILPTINIYCIQEMVVLWDLHFNLHGQLQSKCLRQCALLHFNHLQLRGITGWAFVTMRCRVWLNYEQGLGTKGKVCREFPWEGCLNFKINCWLHYFD